MRSSQRSNKISNSNLSSLVSANPKLLINGFQNKTLEIAGKNRTKDNYTFDEEIEKNKVLTNYNNKLKNNIDVKYSTPIKLILDKSKNLEIKEEKCISIVC